MRELYLEIWKKAGHVEGLFQGGFLESKKTILFQKSRDERRKASKIP